MATAITRVSHFRELHAAHIFLPISTHRERDNILRAGQRAKAILATGYVLRGQYAHLDSQ